MKRPIVDECRSFAEIVKCAIIDAAVTAAVTYLDRISAGIKKNAVVYRHIGSPEQAYGVPVRERRRVDVECKTENLQFAMACRK